MQQTANYGLKKPMGTDVVNIADLNDNADIIDQQLKENKDVVDTKETPAGAQAKADSAETKAKAYADSITPTKVSQLTNDKGYIAASGAPVQSVNGKTGAVSLTAANVGAAPSNHNHDNKYLGKTAKAVDSDKLDGKESSYFAKAADFSRHVNDYIRQPAFAVTSGTSTLYKVTLNPVPVSIDAGFAITIVPHIASGESPKLMINSLGSFLLKKQDNSNYTAGELKANTPYSFRKVGSNFLADSSIGGEYMYFGDGSDGAFNSTANITFSVTKNSGIVIKQYTSFKLNTGHTLTTNYPCRGLIILCQSDVTINGVIDMSQKGGLGSGLDSTFPLPMNLTRSGITDYLYNSMLKGGSGGNGGNGGDGHGPGCGNVGLGGTGSIGMTHIGGVGGGGGGGNASGYSYASGGSGGAAYPYLMDIDGILYGGDIRDSNSGGRGYGGSGGAGVGCSNYGLGGKGIGSGGGAGKGFKSKTRSNGSSGQYPGGYILIISKGNIVLKGYVKANGGNGGKGGLATDTDPNGGGGGGGGAGGGVVQLLYKGNYINNGSIEVKGGVGGAGGAGCAGGDAGQSGTSGNVGSISVKKII